MKRSKWLLVALCCTLLLSICTLFGCKKPQTDPVYTLQFPENLVENSLSATEDGLSFLLNAPDGRQLRFCAQNAQITEKKELIVHLGGALHHEDAIGKITEVSFTTVESSPKLHYALGYTFGADEIENVSGIYEIYRFGNLDKLDLSGLLPNYFTLKAQEGMVESIVSYPLEKITLTSFSITYSPGITGLKGLALDPDFTPAFLAGDPYDASMEAPTPPTSSKTADFALIAVPDAPAATALRKDSSIHGITNGYTTGALKDGEGNICDKSAPLPQGATLEVTFAGKTFDVPLTQKEFTGAQNFSQLVPSAYAKATGNLHALVIPIVWADQKDRATEENLHKLRCVLGRVADGNGTVTDDSQEGFYSLSSYFDIVSYGKLSVDSYITHWYFSEKSFAREKENVLSIDDANAILLDLMENYPDTPWQRFDGDGNGFLDAVIFVNTGGPEGMYQILSNAGAFNSSTYLPQDAAKGALTINTFTSISLGFLHENSTYSAQGRLKTNVLIHEFSHGLGLEDYYDKTFSGIDAVGRYDMQSQNVGDWNAYSKFAAGWITPTVVTEELFAGNASVELTLRSFPECGDCILIPAAGEAFDGSPFGEYILIDLYTDGGVNRYDSAKYGLDGVEGVRIYHVNARQVEKYLQNSDGTLSTIGLPARSNSYGYMAQHFGIYALELIQAGGENTFTAKNGRIVLNAEDLFTPGDCFTTEAYDAFFLSGKMDTGKPLGYQVEILAVEDGTASLRITKQ